MNTLLPIYYQIGQTIKNWIADKEYAPGDKIPSENELAQEFKVSRLTVRQAISQLIREGLLVSRRGYGTTVSDNKSLLNNLTLESIGFVDAIFYQAQKAKTRSAKITRISPSKLIREKLQLSAKDEEVIQIKRVRFQGGVSFNYITNYLPVDIGSKITEDALYKKAFSQILEEDLGIQFGEAFQTISSIFANHEVAEKLGIPSGSPMLFVERIMYTKRLKPVALSEISYRGDRFKYSIRFKKRFKESGEKAEKSWVHRIG
jgi:GntR family transcriptional regulator